MISGYAGLVFREEGFADPRLDAHVSQTILDLVGLAVGAEKDAGELARGRGLRAGPARRGPPGNRQGLCRPVLLDCGRCPPSRAVRALHPGPPADDRQQLRRTRHGTPPAAVGQPARGRRGDAAQGERRRLRLRLQRPLLFPPLLPPPTRGFLPGLRFFEGKGLENPGLGQSPPSSFFSWICSSISSATTSFLRWSLSRSAAMVRRYWPRAAPFLRSKAAVPFSKKASARRRTAWAGAGTRRRGRRRARGRSDGAAGWRPSREAYSSCGAFAW